MYKCVIELKNNRKELIIDHRSAIKAAREYGCREQGEIIRVYSGSTLLSMAKWSGNVYYSCCTRYLSADN